MSDDEVVSRSDESNKFFAVSQAHAAADSWNRSREFAQLMGADLPKEEDEQLVNAILDMMAALTGKTREEAGKINLLDVLPEGSDSYNAIKDLMISLKKPKHGTEDQSA